VFCLCYLVKISAIWKPIKDAYLLHHYFNYR